ncbi:DUF5430 family protein [Vibrio alginolyticus]|uniref:DUF5430 family protein n=1 Tax=Vibrio alginolyticus TaxID=663 RepID=UPI00211A22D0|nr:DUF5430 family protein [Vibrio alginolyticus]MCQ9087355.1 hypothetical protein [Vibrio alginolyticus]
MFWLFKNPTPGGFADNFIKNKDRFDIDTDGRVTLRMDNEETIKSIQEQIRKLRLLNPKMHTTDEQPSETADDGDS